MFGIGRPRVRLHSAFCSTRINPHVPVHCVVCECEIDSSPPAGLIAAVNALAEEGDERIEREDYHKWYHCRACCILFDADVYVQHSAMRSIARAATPMSFVGIYSEDTRLPPPRGLHRSEFVGRRYSAEVDLPLRVELSYVHCAIEWGRHASADIRHVERVWGTTVHSLLRDPLLLGVINDVKLVFGPSPSAGVGFRRMSVFPRIPPWMRRGRVPVVSDVIPPVYDEDYVLVSNGCLPEGHTHFRLRSEPPSTASQASLRARASRRAESIAARGGIERQVRLAYVVKAPWPPYAITLSTAAAQTDAVESVVEQLP